MEDSDFGALDIRTVATLSASHLRSPLPVSDLVTQFEADALAYAALRIGAVPMRLHAGGPSALAKWAASAGAVVTASAQTLPASPMQPPTAGALPG